MAAVESGLPKVQQEPSDALRIVVDNNGIRKARQDDMERSWAKLSIYRIPEYLKDGDKKAYVPQVVSLGPYHHGEERLRPMERHKSRCLHHILARSHHEMGLYLDSVKEVEQRARACYEGTIPMSSDEFTKMMVLDGCFVIELFQGADIGFVKLGYPHNDPIFSSWLSMLKIQIKRDMILLENQIPLFILDRLLRLQLGGPDQDGRMDKLVLQFFKPRIDIGGGWVHFRPSSNQLHCLEVLWQNLLPSDLEQKKTHGWAEIREQLIPCVTKLRKAGIKLRNRLSKHLVDIRFESEDGIVKIPRLVINEGTRSIFLNLIAFEQSHFDCGNHITSYVMFMHNLINSAEDVQYLCDHGIIEHCLGSDAKVVDLFNQLCQELAFDIYDSYLYTLSFDLYLYFAWGYIPGESLVSNRPTTTIKVFNLFCVSYLVQTWRAWIARQWRPWAAHKGRTWIAILKNKYFESPWSIISLIAAFVLLGLTVVQALYAVYGYYKPCS